jgi:hypothetical protein
MAFIVFIYDLPNGLCSAMANCFMSGMKKKRDVSNASQSRGRALHEGRRQRFMSHRQGPRRSEYLLLLDSQWNSKTHQWSAVYKNVRFLQTGYFQFINTSRSPFLYQHPPYPITAILHINFGPFSTLQRALQTFQNGSAGRVSIFC